MTRAARAAVAFACLVLAAGCSVLRGPDAFLPIAGEDAAMAARVSATVAEAESRVALRAVGKLRVDGPRGSGSVRQVILVERPARLRLESQNALGQAATLLATDGERYVFFDGRTLEDGIVSAEVLRARLGLALAPEEAVAALLAAPVGAGAPHDVRARGAEREVRLDGQSLRFSSSGELAAIAALDSSGEVRWSAEYGAWRAVEGGRYPFQVVLTFPTTELRAVLELQSVELNPELDVALFRAPGAPAP